MDLVREQTQFSCDSFSCFLHTKPRPTYGFYVSSESLTYQTNSVVELRDCLLAFLFSISNFV